MSTIYEVMRPGTKGQWRRKKKELRRLGLKSGEWYIIPIEHLDRESVRAGLTV